MLTVSQVGIELDDIAEVSDFTPATLQALAVRLERSSTFQEFIAREIELDELWRRVETGVKAAAEDPSAKQTRRTLEAMFGLVWQAHDLAGDGRTTEAAARLREASALLKG
jgi:hypothetical protein